MPSFFVPARDSRHRAACFALYRALLRQVPRISLPEDLTSRPGWINPIRFLIQSGFRRNRHDTSPRLVTSALKSGYRFLTFLTRAYEPSPERTSIVSFLRKRQAQFPPPGYQKPPPEESNPHNINVRRAELPLLMRVSGPDEKPVYKSTFRPRPLAELSGGVRKVPVVEDASGITFLRIGKPQSHWLANYLRRRIDKRQARISLVQDLFEGDSRRSAQEEDMWDKEVARLAAREGVEMDGAEDPLVWDRISRTPTALYEKSLLEGVHYLNQKLGAEVEDRIARARAMVDIMYKEKALAEEEKRERKERQAKEREERRRKRQEEGQ